MKKRFYRLTGLVMLVVVAVGIFFCMLGQVAAQGLININFTVYPKLVKTGFAATGQSTMDYWNPYFTPTNAVVVSNLEYSDGSLSGAKLTMINAPYYADNGLFDPMLASYAYHQVGNIAVTVSNLVSTNYDIYIYGHGGDLYGRGGAENRNGVYAVNVGATSYGTNATLNGPGWNTNIWQEGINYVVFRGLSLTNPAEALRITVYPGASGYRVISGMQIAPSIPVTPPPQAPIFITQPQSQGVTLNSNVTLSVVAVGTSILKYQWQLNGTNLSGATKTSYTITKAQPAHAGSYSVVITNQVGSITSSNAILTLNFLPSFTTQPQSQTVTAGGTVSFNVVAGGTAPLGYQWLFNDRTILGATNSAYTLTGLTNLNSGNYRVVVTNVAGRLASSNAVLTVLSSPAIVTHPQSQTVGESGTAAFTVSATGNNLNYQWQFNGADIAGATQTNLVLTHVPASQAGNYSVIVSNSIGSLSSSNASLSVIPVNTTTVGLIDINFAASDTDIKSGAAAIGQTTNDYWNVYQAPFATAAAVTTMKFVDGSFSGAGLTVLHGPGHSGNGAADPMYQSYDYATGTNITITVTNLAAGYYDIYIYGHGPSDDANGVYSLKVGKTDYGAKATVNGSTWISAVWSEGIQYVVFRNVEITNLAQVTTVTVSPGASTYALISGMQIGPAASPTPQAPMVVSNPHNTSALAGQNVLFSVTATGANPLAYQWQFNGAAIAGATDSTLALNAVTTNQAGIYSVTVTNQAGSVTSSNATLTVPQLVTANLALLNINFGANAQNLKTGFGAIGQTTNDYWNAYHAPYANAAAVMNLTYSDGNVSAAGLTVLNGPGLWYNGLADPMYSTYDYNQSGPITVTVTNLLGGTYDVYLYGHAPADNGNGVYALFVGNTNYGTNATVNGAGWDSLAWQEGVQYVVFRGVSIADLTQVLTVKVNPGVSGYAIISGMQIVPTFQGTAQAPAIIHQPESRTATAGATVSFGVTLASSSPPAYQWLFNGTAMAGATKASLVLNGVTTNQSGNYSVVASNSVGSVTSSNASLTVNAVANALLNINFAAYATDAKTGFAATGQTTNDYWNVYLAPYANAAAVPNLMLSDGTVSGAGLSVLGGYGHWNSSAFDPMYASYDYNQGHPISITITNFTADNCDIYIYGHGSSNNANGVYALSVDGTNYGTNSTVDGGSWNSAVWQEGAQYVVFRNVNLTNISQVITLKVYPGASGYSIISGIQILPANLTPPDAQAASRPQAQYVNQTRVSPIDPGINLSVSRIGGSLMLSWPSAGTNGVVQESISLEGDTWTDLSTNMINYGTTNLSITVPLPSSPRFYRLKQP
ncbi:MAG: hypothetical protein JWQ71_1490 [Pedosphaera sp.]|nr:hypothetical protein [Pedosphaera sp.]